MDAAHPGPDHRLERLTFFSDAVIAIAITLLVIELHAPHLPPGETGWHQLAELGPEFFGFFLSFAVIGRFWVGHHAALAMMHRYDPRLLVPNLGFLMTTAFMPFATAFMSVNLGREVPTLFYNLTLTVLALFNARIIFVATAQDHAEHEPYAVEARDLRARALSVVVAALLAVAVTFVWPGISQITLLAIPLLRMALARVPAVKA